MILKEMAGSFRRKPLCFFLVPASASLFGHRVTSGSLEGLDCGTFACYRLNNELGHQGIMTKFSVPSRFPMLHRVRTGIGFPCPRPMIVS